MNGRIIFGEIVRTGRMRKTVTLKVDRYVSHKDYGKRVKKTSFYPVHDEKEIAQMGEIWKVQEVPKFSKTKHWVLYEKRDVS